MAMHKNNPYVSGNDIDKVTESLEEASSAFNKGFTDSLMKTNSDINHLLVSRNTNVNIKLGAFEIRNVSIFQELILITP